MSRWRLLGGGAAAVIAIFAIYTFFFADESVGPPSIRIAFATAVIGEGEEAVGVTPYGEVLSAQPAPAEGTLPSLPDAAPPKSGRLSGPMLAQAKVLGAAPGPLRPCIARSYYGESGVDVELRSGIELFFGDADPGRREVELGDHGPGQPGDHGARLCRPALAEAAVDRRLEPFAAGRG